MNTVLLATPFLAQHADAGIFWLAALGRANIPVIAWDYRREPWVESHQASLMIALKTPADPGRFRGPRVCYWPDALGRDPESESKLSEYDRVYTCLRPTPEGWHWLPTGWDPGLHYPRMTEEDKRLDTIFIGTQTPRKARFIKAVTESATILDFFMLLGNGWHSERGAVYMDDYCASLSSARISINVHRDEIGVNRRFFESIACTFTLTDLVPGVEEILGKELADAVGFRTPGELQEKVSHYLKDPDGRTRLWELERTAILPYTYNAAVDKILKESSFGGGPIQKARG